MSIIYLYNFVQTRLNFIRTQEVLMLLRKLNPKAKGKQELTLEGQVLSESVGGNNYSLVCMLILSSASMNMGP